MKEIRFFYVPDAATAGELPVDEAIHAVRVLRLKAGDELSLLDCQFSERRQMKVPRLEKILVSAMKQSRKAWKPELHDMQLFAAFLGVLH